MAADVAFRHLPIPSTRPDDCTADSCTLSLSIGWHDCMPFPGSHSVDRRIGAPHTWPLAAAARVSRSRPVSADRIAHDSRLTRTGLGTHYQRSPCFGMSFVAGAGRRGFAPAPPGFIAWCLSRCWARCRKTDEKGGCRSIPPYRSVEATETALGLLPSVGPWGHGQNREGTDSIMKWRGPRYKPSLQWCSIRARFSSVAPGSVIKTVVTPTAAR